MLDTLLSVAIRIKEEFHSSKNFQFDFNHKKVEIVFFDLHHKNMLLWICLFNAPSAETAAQSVKIVLIINLKNQLNSGTLIKIFALEHCGVYAENSVLFQHILLKKFLIVPKVLRQRCLFSLFYGTI